MGKHWNLRKQGIFLHTMPQQNLVFKNLGFHVCRVCYACRCALYWVSCTFRIYMWKRFKDGQYCFVCFSFVNIELHVSLMEVSFIWKFSIWYFCNSRTRSCMLIFFTMLANGCWQFEITIMSFETNSFVWIPCLCLKKSWSCGDDKMHYKMSYSNKHGNATHYIATNQTSRLLVAS